MNPDLHDAGVAAPPTGWHVWWTAARPRTLLLAATPVLVGIALAWAEGATLQAGIGLATLLAALFIQVGTNLHNDAADCERGNDGSDRLGPLRVTAAGWASAARVRNAARLAFAAAFLLGCYLAAVGGWPIVAIGIGSLVAGVAYSGGSHPISHTSWGELFVWLFFGVLAVAGSYWLQAARLSPAAILTGVALGFPAAAVLLVNNLRDAAADVAVGRRTFATLLGDAGARRLHTVLVLAPFPSLPMLAVLLPGRHGLWLAVLALPACLKTAMRMRTATGTALNGVLADTARAQFLFGLFLSIGCLLP